MKPIYSLNVSSKSTVFFLVIILSHFKKKKVTCSTLATGTLHFGCLWHFCLCLGCDLWHSLAGGGLGDISGLLLLLGCLDGVIALFLTDLWFLLLLGEQLGVGQTSDGLWSLDVASDTALQ